MKSSKECIKYKNAKKQVIYSKSTFKSYFVLKIVKPSISAMLRENLYLDYCNNPKFSDRQALALALILQTGFSTIRLIACALLVM